MRLVEFEECGANGFINVTEIASVIVKDKQVMVVFAGNNAPISIDFSSEEGAKHFYNTILESKKRGL